VVYSKHPFGGAQHALRYLGQYTHRVAISNHRLITELPNCAAFMTQNRCPMMSPSESAWSVAHRIAGW
jgi:hypothetical protein